MREAITKYNKDFIYELLDITFMNKDINNSIIREHLINNGIIKKTTKIIKTRVIKRDPFVFISDEDTIIHNDKVHIIKIYNGRNQIVFNAKYLKSDIPNIIRELNDIID